jgi:hypothetical protein
MEMSIKEAQDQLVSNMRQWQKIENAAVVQTAKIMKETDNPLIRLVMEIIQRDSNMHHRVQRIIADSLEKEALNVGVDELEKVWDSIEKHIEIEKQTIKMATDSLAAFEGGKSDLVQRYLLSYLLEDEKKHDKLLADLELIKKGMYP